MAYGAILCSLSVGAKELDYLNPTKPNKSFDRTARQRASHVYFCNYIECFMLAAGQFRRSADLLYYKLNKQKGGFAI
jgi:hypothetical protein